TRRQRPDEERAFRVGDCAAAKAGVLVDSLHAGVGHDGLGRIEHLTVESTRVLRMDERPSDRDRNDGTQKRDATEHASLPFSSTRISILGSPAQLRPTAFTFYVVTSPVVNP